MRSIKYILAVIAIISPAFAEVRLPACLSDNMVLQQKSQVKIWGWAAPDEEVTVLPGWSAMVSQTKADANGKWMIFVTTPVAGGPYTLDISAENKLQLQNIMLGEVWLCSGQSNMQFELQQALNNKYEVTTADHPNIRLLYIPRSDSAQPRDDSNTKWEVCTPETAKRCSAVGYFFGRELYEKLDVPIGIITSAYGGTPAEAWTRTKVIADNPELKPIYERDLEYLANRPQLEEDFKAIIEQWKVDKQSNPSLKQPRYPDNLRMQHRSGYLFNSMIHPLLNYRIRGAIWYQGETNEPRAYQYAELFKSMINNWRTEWGYQLPFYFVQIAPYHYSKPEGTTCPELQESQQAALTLPHTGMAVINDVGNINDVHPKNKQAVGKRLSLLALSDTYDFAGITCYGPMYKNMSILGSKAIINFNWAENGLKANGKLKEFEIAGADQVFYPAQAEIVDKAVVVTCDSVSEPVAVRFAWHNSVERNLFNAEGLPAGPFRTDNWPCSTYEIR